jgi:hypothetical protein
MADITITCETCGNTLSVSEYAKSEDLKCTTCGTELNRPHPVTPRTDDDADSGRPALKLAKREAPEPVVEVPEEPSAPGEGKATPQPVIASIEQTRKFTAAIDKPKRSISGTFIGWALLVLIGVPLAWWRYRIVGGVQLEALNTFGRTWGPAVLLPFHLTVCVFAFRDEFFVGIMCVLVPFYSLIHIFGRTDLAAVRVPLTLFLIAMGPETMAGTAYYLSETYHEISAWIGQYEREAGQIN